MTHTRRTFRVVLTIAAMIAAVLVPSVAQPLRADALSAADWDPGYIISDENFYNGSAMSEAEIQRFLENVVGSCQNSNCLAVHRADTPTRTWSFGTCSTYVGGAGESAARIIFKVQQACGLSAKVILVTLQKEQSLLTNRAPSDGIMRKAMGYGCPDTAACDSTYYGFFNQLFAAARQLTWYGNPAGSFTSIRVGQVNAIRYHPDAGCGTKDVLVRNRATAALYYYTPYTPNAAALANLGGTGDGCSAYGNRNFWVFYNTWFGSATLPGAAAIAQLWHSLGGSGGILGDPTSDYLTIIQNGGGLGQAFEGGSIYWTAATGAQYIVLGPIRDYYFARSGAAGPLAFPASPPIAVGANGGGRGQVFQRGSVYSSDFGTFTVAGSIRDVYWSYAGAGGTLGWPTAEQSSSPAKGGGVGQGFQAGAVFSSAAGTWAVLGAFQEYYAQHGSASGALGWPTSGPMAIPQNGGGTGQAFGDGSLYRRTGGSPVSVLASVRSLYFGLGGAAGALGWPTAEQSCSGGVCVQPFTNASIRVDSSGASWFAPAIDQAYLRAGGAATLRSADERIPHRRRRRRRHRPRVRHGIGLLVRCRDVRRRPRHPRPLLRGRRCGGSPRMADGSGDVRPGGGGCSQAFSGGRSTGCRGTPPGSRRPTCSPRTRPPADPPGCWGRRGATPSPSPRTGAATDRRSRTVRSSRRRRAERSRSQVASGTPTSPAAARRDTSAGR